jgi:hypothetical protein
MTRFFTLLMSCLLLSATRHQAQSFSPIGLTGYNFDAVAEANTALAHTSGALDGSDYVMYSAAYGSLYSVSNGLPNSGLIVNGNYTFQLTSYSGNNICYTPGGVTDSLIFASPAPYAGLSLLCFSTEGNGSMVATVRFTDNSTQVFNGLALTDWFGSGSAILSGFDRVTRSGTTPANISGNPKLFAIDLTISCANRGKSIRNIKFQNTGTTSRNCIFAVSGAAIPAYTATASPVTCSGGSNGSAMVQVSGGLPPYTYSWSTMPSQHGVSASSLSIGVYSVTVQDAGLCPVTTTVSVTQSLSPQPPLFISASIYTACAGQTVQLTASGAVSYTWDTQANSTTISVTPASNSIYTVSGITAFNCYRSGSIHIAVNPLPVVTFSLPAGICGNQAPFTLNAQPAGGSFAGPGVTSNTYFPGVAGPGSQSVTYSYTDPNGCKGTATGTTTIHPPPVLSFSISAGPLCLNSAPVTLSASPGNGTFTGNGVNGSVYSPSVAGVGTQSVSYSYTDANNCTNTVVSQVMINHIPGVIFQSSTRLYSVCSPSVKLNGLPGGGTFSGPGLSAAGAFAPSSAGVGTHTLEYSYTDANQCTGRAALITTVTSCTGIHEYSASGKLFSMYPNPTGHLLSIEPEEDLFFSLFNEQGQLIMSLELQHGIREEISVSDLPPGIYFITARHTSGIKREKLVILR